MHRWRWAIVGIVAVGLVVAAGWWYTRPEPVAKVPPEVPISDPAVAGVVAKARAEVVAHPTDAALWGKLGQTYLANGLLPPAHECLAEAGRLNPTDPRWPYLEGVSLLLSDPVAAMPCWQRAAECPGNDDLALTARLRWAEALLANDRAAEADRVLRGLLDQRSNDPRLQMDLGLLEVARNNPQAAVEHFQRCADHPSARRRVAIQLAALYNALGKTAEAAEYSRRVETFPPDADWPDPFLESYLNYTVGREALFIQAGKQLQSNPLEAISLFRSVIEQYPDEARAYPKLGMLLAESGDYAGAEQVLRDGLRVSPNMVQGYFFLAAALFPQAERLGLKTPAGQEKLRQTAAAAKRATELKPDHGLAYLYLGLSLKNLGQKAEAIAALREAVRCTPDATDTHLHLGEALAEDGQTKAALEELETAVRIAPPNDSRPRAALERVKAAMPPKK